MVAIPLQCTAIANGVLYMRSVELHKKAKRDLGTNLLDRQALHPLYTVMVHENDVEKSLNETIKLWNESYARIKTTTDLKHAQLHHSTVWTLTTMILTIGGAIVVPTILIMEAYQIYQCCKQVKIIPSAPALVEQKVFSSVDCSAVVKMIENQYPTIRSQQWNQGGARFMEIPRESFNLMKQAQPCQALRKPEESALVPRFTMN